MPRLILPSFAKGELSPDLYGRVDTTAYQSGLRTASNMNIHTYGGASNRQGLKYLEPVKNHSETPRLIPFRFKTTDQYILEFGNQYMRVMRDDAHVLEGSTESVISGATAANPVVITSTAHPFSDGDEVFIKDVAGMTELNGRRFLVSMSTANTFELQDQYTGVDVDGSSYTAYTSGGSVTKIYEISTPYLLADLFEITYEQDKDVLTLCHKDYGIRELSRADHDNWTLSEPTFVPTIDDPTGVTVTVNSTAAVTDRYRVTAIAENGNEESLPGVDNTSQTITNATQTNPVVISSTSHGFIEGDEVEIASIVGMTELNNRRFTVTNPNANDFELQGEDGTGHSAYASAGTATGTWTQVTNSHTTRNNTIAWSAVADAFRYAVYRRDNGVYGLIGETELLSFTDSNIEPDTSQGVPLGRNPFENENNPGAVGFFEQRRVFGGSNDNPDTSNYSQTGRISNFNIHSPLQSDDAITANLRSREVNEIRGYVALNDLIVLTSVGEWRVNSGPDTSFAWDTIRQKPQTYYGSSYLKPIVIGSTIIYVSDNLDRVRSLGYSFTQDSYSGTNLLLLSNHLMEHKSIVDFAHTINPETRLYYIAQDDINADENKMLAMTFDQEQEVLAWSTWNTDGDFKSVASLRATGDDFEDSVYFVVRRVINGTVRRYIEVWRQSFFDSVEDCFYVDSGLTFDNPVTITGITAANPVVVTAPSHGFSDGDFVDLSNIIWDSSFDSVFTETQPDQLNGGRYKVANKTTNTFELNDKDDNAIDGSSFNAYKSNGTARKVVSTITGLWHLEGESIVALLDGSVEDSLTVSNGSVSVDPSISRGHFGLRYVADLETLDLESPQGTTQGQKKKVNHVIVRVRNSRSFHYGPHTGLLQEAKFRQYEEMDEPTRWLTGDKKVNMRPDWNSNGRILLRQYDPLPMNILAIIPHIELGDEE